MFPKNQHKLMVKTNFTILLNFVIVIVSRYIFYHMIILSN
jgi:hypothetical protein